MRRLALVALLVPLACADPAPPRPVIVHVYDTRTCAPERDSVALLRMQLQAQRALNVAAEREAMWVSRAVWAACRDNASAPACRQKLPNLVGWTARAFAHSLPDTLR